MVIETPRATMRARARLVSSLAPDVVCAQFGWWQACEPLGLPGLRGGRAGRANYNALIDTDVTDPLSGTVPLRSVALRGSPTQRHAGLTRGAGSRSATSNGLLSSIRDVDARVGDP